MGRSDEHAAQRRAGRVWRGEQVSTKTALGDYKRLNPDLVVKTLELLQGRIASRFGGRGLSEVAEELIATARQIAATVDAPGDLLQFTPRAARALSGVVILVAAIVVPFALRDAVTEGPGRSFDWLPLIESTINDLVFAAIAVFFLNELPNRLERRRLLPQLHRARSLAHIVDMHQLPKAPEQLGTYATSEKSPAEGDLNRDDTEQYLEYCSEILSLIGKIAALCAEKTQDSVVLNTVSTIETLTTELSQKIWQKISLLPPADTTRTHATDR